MKYLFTNLILFLSLSTHAEFTGIWSGSGNGFDQENTTYGCDITEFGIEQSATEFKIKSGTIWCGLLGWSWGETVFGIAGDKLTSGGLNVGTFSSNKIQFKIQSPNSNTFRDVELNLADDTLTYHEQKIDNNGVFFTIDASLTKTNSVNILSVDDPKLIGSWITKNPIYNKDNLEIYFAMQFTRTSLIASNTCRFPNGGFLEPKISVPVKTANNKIEVQRAAQKTEKAAGNTCTVEVKRGFVEYGFSSNHNLLLRGNGQNFEFRRR